MFRNSPRQRNLVILAVRVVVALGLILGVTEAFARFALGFGTPPLTVAHPLIEYMFAPNQNVVRFGNRQIYNEIGMRSPPLADVDQARRVMVFGDSVINGGNLTDQAELATTLATDGDVFFGNVSAGSWGPANIRAWIEEYGFQGADAGVFVLSSHDLNDLPMFAPLDPQTHPTKRPILALWEIATRYAPRYIPGLAGEHPLPHRDDAKIKAAGLGDNGPDEVEKLVDVVARAGLPMCVVLHAARSELVSGFEQDHDALTQILTRRGVPVLNDSEAFSIAQEGGESVYRDNIHITAAGQAHYVDLLKRCASSAKVPDNVE